MFGKVIPAVAATVLIISSSTASWAADISAPAPAQMPAPLAPGQAAGVRTAQDMVTDHTLFVVGGLAIVGVGVGLLVSNHGGRGTQSVSTTSTSSTGTN